MDYLRDLRRWGTHLRAGREQEAAAVLERMALEHRRCLQAGVFLPLEYLFAVMPLSDFECFCVRLAVLAELEPAFMDEGCLCPERAIRLYDRDRDAGPAYYPAFGAEGLLRRFIFDDRQAEKSFGMDTALRLHPRIRGFVLEGQMANERLAPFVVLWEPEPGRGETGGSDGAHALTAGMRRFLERAQDDGKGTAFLLTGPAGVGKKRQARHFCRCLEQAVLFVDMRALLARGALPADLQAALLRECVIRQAVLCLCGLDILWQRDAAQVSDALFFMRQALTLSNLLLATSRTELPFVADYLADGLISVALPMPAAADRRELWRRLAAPYALAPEVCLDDLAHKFVLTPGRIKGALAQAQTRAVWRGRDSITEADLYQGCYHQLKQGLTGSKARKVPVVFGWDDLVLPPASKRLLRTACDQVRYRQRVYREWGFGAKLPYGRGLSLLLSGPPGTGKTMGAQVVAGELQLELYKVDLAGVVSKYVGETEKNLREIFREGARSQAVLFFDEADVLFNKRTEVKEAQDRYGNMEAAFMLQEIEEYDGICVLATNYLQNIDEAFKRRLKFVVEFPFPNAVYRAQLWPGAFPAAVPLEEGLDWGFLAAHFELSGSNIKNIAVNAAFTAAARGKAVGMAEILSAVRHELAKSGKTLSPAECGEYYMLLQEGEKGAGAYI